MTDVVSLIRAKRDGGRLSDAEIGWLFDGYAKGTVADEQMAALLMAICFTGMDEAELTAWTGAMIGSGERLDLSPAGRPTVDKHSTGGVGDKVSLVLVPLLAACGAAVPQLSGRGLGHTGGTLDKMDAISGFTSELSPERFLTVLTQAGAVIAAAGPELAPADRRLYALRDVTGTVESVPLIASSIISKKVAEGTQSLVLDVKTGSGAFLPGTAAARRLASVMVRLGNRHGVRTSALITAMDTPLGRAAGNAVEVEEAVRVLRGGGPADLVELTCALAREALALAGIDADPEQALASGRAHDVWRRMVRAQGGDPDAPLPQPRHIEAALHAPADGWLSRLDARRVGVAAWRLGAGRARKEDEVSAAAGVICLVKPGEPVRRGQPVLQLRTDEEDRVAAAIEALDGAITVTDSRPPPAPLILERIG